MIDVVFDIDGVLVAEHVESAYEEYSHFLELLPESWRTYHQGHVNHSEL